MDPGNLFNGITASDLAEAHDIKSFETYGGIKGLLDALETGSISGISSQTMGIRGQYFGTNDPPVQKKKSFFNLLLDAANDTTMILLAIAAVISIVVKYFESRGTPEESHFFIDGLAILIACVIVIFVTASNEYNQAQQFAALDKKNNSYPTDVLRDGLRATISVTSVVVGDIVFISQGCKIPADGLLIVGTIGVDQAALTGEPELIRKNRNEPYCYSGTMVKTGEGLMVVTGVGEYSAWGTILKSLAEEEEERSPLQNRLDNVVILISKIGFGFAIATAIAMFVSSLISQKVKLSSAIIDSLIAGITIVVVAIPEGLPLAVTISLAYSMRQMFDQQNLVRKLPSCETMGNADVICSDKTGTLTEGKMSVVRMHIGLQDLNANDMPKESAVDDLVRTDSDTSTVPLPVNSTPLPSMTTSLNSDDEPEINYETPEMISEKDIFADNFVKSKSIWTHFRNVCLLNSTAFRSPSGEWAGNITETALIQLFDPSFEYTVAYRSEQEENFIARYPFDSTVKQMHVVYLDNGTPMVLSKGSPEILIESCSSYMDIDGKVKPLLPSIKLAIKNMQEKFANDALRTLGLAFKYDDNYSTTRLEGPSEEYPPVSYDLCWIGMVGILDPLREGVFESVNKCKKAGIAVKMVTGDHISTAKRIAKDCGIYKDGIAIEAETFRKMTDEQLINEILPDLEVIGRAKPLDKQRMVRLYKEMGHIVAVTGDGTNDAPALKGAHVGLAMGITGTEVAKQAADIVILDDNFKSIVTAVLWGRSVFDNIRKFIQFQLTVNVSALMLTFISAVTGKTIPLTPAQLLWVNLIMDTMAALALATEPPIESLLHRKPTSSEESIISPLMWIHISVQAVYQLIILLFFVYTSDTFFPPEFTFHGDQSVELSFIFNTFVFLQVFNEFNARRVNGELNFFSHVFSSFLFPFIILITILCQICLINWGGIIAGTVPLSVEHWFLSVVIGASCFIPGFITRLVTGFFQKTKKLATVVDDVDNQEKEV
eukprot:TRINITY_DN3112_c0_g2_i3.p1 TRINITY_DN3112_c0_g2~~TRINITY_DN3112_c0_g2_i3.p1  ORF type:complete len:1000 (-),score=272.15 TRINITY_DN3112_c0_g2_i3:2107-5106(-)